MVSGESAFSRAPGEQAPSYALVTPARDEAKALARLADSVLAQTVHPRCWVIVDNGSSDETALVARQLAEREPWIRATATDGTTKPEPGAPVVHAFHKGLAALAEPVDVVVKLDADVTFEPDYLQLLVRAFAADPKLGIASGACYELAHGDWKPTHVTGAHVRGATRAYRWACLQQLLPLEEGMGWDTIDELKATLAGWRTAIVPGLRFYHHRAVGERDGAGYVRWKRQGILAHYVGYRPGYLLLRVLHQARRRPAALAMLWGYASAAARRTRRYPDDRVRALLREEQRMRRLPMRIREALGRSAR